MVFVVITQSNLPSVLTPGEASNEAKDPASARQLGVWFPPPFLASAVPAIPAAGCGADAAPPLDDDDDVVSLLVVEPAMFVLLPPAPPPPFSCPPPTVSIDADPVEDDLSEVLWLLLGCRPFELQFQTAGIDWCESESLRASRWSTTPDEAELEPPLLPPLRACCPRRLQYGRN